MRRRFYLTLWAPLFWALGLAFTYGTVLTREASTHLLEKNRALLAIGEFALPGVGHLETMASWKPALAGGLFYALSLGLGAAALAYCVGFMLAWIMSRYGMSASLMLLIAAAAGLLIWDLPVGGVLALVATPCAWAGMLSGKNLFRGSLRSWVLVTVALALVTVVAGRPVLPFSILRNGLLCCETTRAINDFYYRWTLYPALTIKPVTMLSQPTATVVRHDSDMDTRNVEDALRQAGFLLRPSSYERQGQDLLVSVTRENVTCDWYGVRKSWQIDPEAFSEHDLRLLLDSKAPERKRRTAVYLSLSWGLSAWIYMLLSLGFIGTRGGLSLRGGAVLLLILLLVLFAYHQTSAMNHYLDRVRKRSPLHELGAALYDRNPLVRIAAIEGARRYGYRYAGDLMTLLQDPVLNVRYNAARALGRIPTQEVRAALQQVILDPGCEWYLKDSAYGALADHRSGS